MSTMRQFDPLVVNDYVTDIYQFAPHRHTYYELIYIFKGNGTHLLNNNQFHYQAGDLFLMAPDDHHHFEVKQATRFIVIKFTEHYFSTSHLRNTEKDLVPQVLMQARSLKENKVSFSQTAALSLRNTVQNITRYKDDVDLAHSNYIYFQ
ncbi:AraC family ligand binding domain-containing protein [Desertivirga xinjiangensis]|uniref:AraC family ligand binding domain-containing protein n=1 Tax=Desertivirga xinjiangensis TaxID=539206 RepID=UPI002108C98A|nr:AraC family ligand binding domain-containing protein [Pedobacter xinjiangensis]